jgi:hypothetical protein
MGAVAFSPSLNYVTDFALRSTGVALTNRLNTDRSPVSTGGSSDEDIVELEVDEDGGLRIFMGRLSDSRVDRFADTKGSTPQQLFPKAAVIYTRQLVALTAAAAEEAGFLGTWLLALGATGMRGLPVDDFVRQGINGPRYDADDYLQATTSSYSELLTQPRAVTERLVGRLLRSLGVHRRYEIASTDATSDQVSS